jgi:hypothetical protein
MCNKKKSYFPVRWLITLAIVCKSLLTKYNAFINLLYINTALIVNKAIPENNMLPSERQC